MENRRPPPSSIASASNWPRESNIIKIASDNNTIASYKTLVFENSSFLLDHGRSDYMPVMDPLTPPILLMSRASDASDRRYLLTRLREPSILKSLILFLAYLHDQTSSVCFEGNTKTYSIDSAEVGADFSAFRSFVPSES